ncbi:MAG: asparagine synthase-related protein, partial [Chloroflexota bacterium]
MCGFFGWIAIGDAHKARPLSHQCQRAIIQELKLRGRDGFGLIDEPGQFLAHSRLAIRGDEKDAAQPFETPNSSRLILFNGEIYSMKGAGQTELKSRGDTYALKKALDTQDTDTTLKRLNGMFAIAILDKALKQLTLGVDYFGQKPLFYGMAKSAIIFGSTAQLVALALDDLTSSREIDKKILTHYLMYGFPHPEQTIWKNIQKVPPGGRVSINLQTCTVQTNSEFQETNEYLRDESTEPNNLDTSITEAVHRHMISDHPVGMCLSGGIDSSLVASKLPERLIAFSVDDKSPQSEIEQARLYANQLALPFVTCDLTNQDFSNFFNLANSCLDEPHADSAIVSSAALFDKARRQVKVVLTGDGGDEL